MWWDPIHEDDDKHYAPLVHNGAKDYFQDDPDEPENTRDYVARPWTFLLAPADQRDETQLNAIAGENPVTKPQTSWDFALRKFDAKFKQYIGTTYKVI
jgi:hypothetical protein